MKPIPGWMLVGALLAATAVLGGCSKKSSSTDKRSPVITVTGAKTMKVAYSSTYTDEGATANDNEDGPVTVVKSGNVDTLTPGDYIITYKAVDAAGNESTATRTVTVEARQFRVQVSSFGNATFTASNGKAFECSPGGDLCSASFDAGTQLTITAAAATGWNFQGWSNCGTATAAACQVTVDSDKLVLSTATRSAAVTVKADVVALTNAQIAAIRSYDASNNSLIFQAGTSLGTIQAGNVIVAGGGTAKTIYFIRRVVNILTLTGAPTVVETVPASLDDVIQQGTLVLKLDQPLRVQQAVPAPAPSVAYLTPDMVHAAAAVPAFTLAQSSGVSVTASGSVGVSLLPQLAIDFTLEDGLRQLRLSATSTVSAEFGVAVVGEGSVAGNARFPLPKINAGSFTTTIPVGPLLVPISFVLELEPFVEGKADGSFKAAIHPNVGAQTTGMLGTQWHVASGWSSLSALTLTGQASVGTELQSEVGLELLGGMEAGVELYDFIGPKFTGRAYGGFRANATPLDSQGCTLALRTYGGLSGSVGGEIEILSRTLSIDSDPLVTERTYSLTPSGCDKQDPVGPATVTAVPGGPGEILLSWSAGTDDVGVTGYEVWREGGTRAGQPFLLQETATLALTDSGLPDATQFCYYVLAVDSLKHRSPVPAQKACATTLPDDSTPPSAPVIVAGNALSSSSVEITWTASTDNQSVAGYTVYNASTPYPTPFRIAQTALLKQLVSRLKPDTEYCFRVTAFDYTGNESAQSNRLCVTTKPVADSEWSIFLGCQAREFIIRAKLDLDQTLNSQVQVTGSGVDYPGTPLTYFLTGNYTSASSQLSADIFWSFANSSLIRQDRFTANLASGDSGTVPMTQVQVTGCNAQIRVVRNAIVGSSAVSTPVFARPPEWTSMSAGPALLEVR